MYCEESVRAPAAERRARRPRRSRAARDSEVLPSPTRRGEVIGRGTGAATTPSATSSTDDSRSSTSSGRVASRRCTESTTTSKARSARFKLFDNAAGYDAVRREIGALRKVHHPERRQGLSGPSKTEPATGTSSRSTSTASRSTSTPTARRSFAIVRRSTSRSTSSTHSWRSTPTRRGSSELDAKKRDGELSEAEYDEWMELQEKGLVHRDIKPQNVMLTRTGAKLLDFNIASRVGDPV